MDMAPSLHGPIIRRTLSIACSQQRVRVTDGETLCSMTVMQFRVDISDLGTYCACAHREMMDQSDSRNHLAQWRD
jgi:hypothetical protein